MAPAFPILTSGGETCSLAGLFSCLTVTPHTCPMRKARSSPFYRRGHSSWERSKATCLSDGRQSGDSNPAFSGSKWVLGHCPVHCGMRTSSVAGYAAPATEDLSAHSPNPPPREARPKSLRERQKGQDTGSTGHVLGALYVLAPRVPRSIYIPGWMLHAGCQKTWRGLSRLEIWGTRCSALALGLLRPSCLGASFPSESSVQGFGDTALPQTGIRPDDTQRLGQGPGRGVGSSGACCGLRRWT